MNVEMANLIPDVKDSDLLFFADFEFINIPKNVNPQTFEEYCKKHNIQTQLFNSFKRRKSVTYFFLLEQLDEKYPRGQLIQDFKNEKKFPGDNSDVLCFPHGIPDELFWKKLNKRKVIYTKL